MSEEKPESVNATPAGESGTAITLPCGILRNKMVYRDAEIIPMTGFTRKSIAREDVRGNPVKTTDIILAHCLKRVGPVTSITPKFLAEMLIGDRDFLLLEIRNISMGDTITSKVDCEGCKNKIEVRFKLNELEDIVLKDGDYEIVDRLPTKEGVLEMKDGLRVFRMEIMSPSGLFSAKCRYPNGGDQVIIVEHMQKNPIAANYKMYAACLLEWGGESGPFNESFFDGLPVTVLDDFEEAFNAALPGPVLRQEVPCPVCKTIIELTFQGSDFLFHLPKRGTR